MKKKAQFSSLMQSFEAFRKVKTASESSLSQGTSESSASTPGKDAEVSKALPNGGEIPGSDPKTKETERGAVAGEKLPDQPTNIPEQELERKEQPADAKIAAASTEELIARLREGLVKAASAKADPEVKEQKPAEPASVPETKETERGVVAEEKLPDQPEPKTASDEQAIEVLAQKTAEFLSQYETGYELARRLLSPTVKTAGNEEVNAEAVAAVAAEEASQKVASHVFSSVEAEVAAGTLSPEQGVAVLTKMGFDVEAVLTQRQIEQSVNSYVQTRKVAGATDEQIMSELAKLAEADAAAMAAAPAEAGGADEAQLAQEVAAAISELESAVNAGEITEDEALQILQEAGLNVEGLLAAAGAEGGAPAAPAAEPAAPEAPAEPAAPEAPAEPAKEKASEGGEEKKAEGEVPPSGAPGQGAQLPPEIEQMIAQIDQLLQSGQITEEQAVAAVQALLAEAQGGAAPAAPAAPEAVPAAPVA